jgi:hypothetical protein
VAAPAAAVGVEQHTLGVTILGCVWVWHHWGHAWRTKIGTK